MSKENVIIVGASGHSKVIIDCFEKEGKYEILGLLDSNRTIGEETLGYKIIGTDSNLSELLLENPNCKLFVAIGDNWIRYKVIEKLSGLVPNLKFASTIHPSAQIGKNVRIGEGVVVLAGAIVNCATEIGDYTIINTKASIDHDSCMLKYSSLAPNVTTGGNVVIGEYSAVSIGATIKHGVTIGCHSLIGAGTLLLNDCPDNTLMYGFPAREVRKREIGEAYF